MAPGLLDVMVPGGIELCSREDLASLFGDERSLFMPKLQNGNMDKRGTMSKGQSKRSFTKHAMHSKSQNFVQGVMRGGIRF